MKEIIKTILLKCWIGKAVYYLVHNIHYYTISIFLFSRATAGMYLRILGLSRKHSNLKKFKNIHKGERCFVIATGPSLTIEDVEKLKNETTFAMNSFVKVLDKISFTPTYYGIVDGDVYGLLRDDVRKSNLNIAFIGDWRMKRNYYKDLPFYRFSTKRTIHYRIKNPKFSNDISKIVYDGGTITYCLLQIAAYMGFKEIYLLGADCNYAPEVKNFADYRSEQEIKQQRGLNQSMLNAYKSAKRYADAHQIKIYNATRGGKLEIFPRVNLDRVLRD